MARRRPTDMGAQRDARFGRGPTVLRQGRARSEGCTSPGEGRVAGTGLIAKSRTLGPEGLRRAVERLEVPGAQNRTAIGSTPNRGPARAPTSWSQTDRYNAGTTNRPREGLRSDRVIDPSHGDTCCVDLDPDGSTRTWMPTGDTVNRTPLPALTPMRRVLHRGK